MRGSFSGRKRVADWGCSTVQQRKWRLGSFSWRTIQPGGDHPPLLWLRMFQDFSTQKYAMSTMCFFERRHYLGYRKDPPGHLISDLVDLQVRDLPA